MEKQSKTNIKDLANACGVSITTISRYFNQPELLSSGTKAKIQTILSELNYHQSGYMQLTNSDDSSLIAVIFPHLQFGFYTEFLNQLIEHGKEKGDHFIPYTSTGSKENELMTIQKLKKYNIKGLILLSPLLSAQDIEALPFPTITVERSGGNFMQINNDNFTGGKLAAELLLKNHCEVFIHINNDYSTSWPSFKRIVGFECCIEGHDYERIICHTLTEPFKPEATIEMEQIVQKMLQKYPNKKWGVFCSNDDIARLFEQQCIRNHLELPKQVELIGYDNSPVSDHAVYPITSVDQNISLMAQIAVDAFENYIPCETIVPSMLIPKSTTS